MIDSKKLLTDLKRQVTLLENDLRQRCKDRPEIDAPLRAQHAAASAGKRTAMTYSAWLDEQLTQVAVAWVLACVFVRFLEDNALVEVPKIAGPGLLGQRARDEHELYFRQHPTLSEREYLESVFTETGTLPAMREFFDRRHNPLWQCGPSGDAAAALLDFWRKTDPDTGLLVHDFSPADGGISNLKSEISNIADTRFLGDLYQDLSEAARKKYALLQTPEFIEEFILDRTLGPAIDTFGYQIVRMIDPTCGSGHFLLGGFSRMFRLWQRENPGENPRVLAQHALNAIHGVDLNPYAVAIARFRLLLAALQVCGITKLKNAPDFTIHLASGDSLLHGRRFRESEGVASEMTFDTEEIFRDELKHHYEVEDAEALHRILGQQYHAVVGNPPYITVKDRAVSELYRARFPSCGGKYSLSVPFMERFFDLTVKGDGTPLHPAGFAGKITGSSFMKREFGKKLIEQYLPLWDLTHVIDTDKAHIPGHATGTVILFGKNQQPCASTLRAVMGIKKQEPTPEMPEAGLVWLAILKQVDVPGSQGEWVSTSDSPRDKFHHHPWSIGGGGASELKDEIDEACEMTVLSVVEIKRKKPNIGFASFTGLDEAFLSDRASLLRLRVEPEYCRDLVKGDIVRDWTIAIEDAALVPCDQTFSVVPLAQTSGWGHYLWPNRTALRNVESFETTREEEGSAWWSWYRWIPEKYRRPLSMSPLRYIGQC